MNNGFAQILEVTVDRRGNRFQRVTLELYVLIENHSLYCEGRRTRLFFAHHWRCPRPGRVVSRINSVNGSQPNILYSVYLVVLIVQALIVRRFGKHDNGFEDEDPFEFMMEKRSNQVSEVLVLLLIVYSGFVFLRGRPVFASFCPSLQRRIRKTD